jgi:hypothetical protein
MNPMSSVYSNYELEFELNLIYLRAIVKKFLISVVEQLESAVQKHARSKGVKGGKHTSCVRVSALYRDISSNCPATLISEVSG